MSIIYQYRLRNQVRNMSDYFKNKWKDGDPEAKNFYEWLSTIDQYVPDSMDGGLYSQTGDTAAITNTTEESSIIDGGVGVLYVPANNFRVGDSFVARISGILSCINNAGITIRIKSNNIDIANTGSITLLSALNNYYDIDLHFTVRSIGPAGTASLMTSGWFMYNKASNNTPDRIGFENLDITNFDTTIDNQLDVTIQWDTADIGNSIDSHMFNLYKIF